jgi:hypothetical protein
MDDRRDGGTVDVRRGITSVGGFCASMTCASFSSSILRTNFIPQKSISEHLNRKHARHVPIIVAVIQPPAIPEIAIQKLSDIVFTIGTFKFDYPLKTTQFNPTLTITKLTEGLNIRPLDPSPLLMNLPLA